MAQQQVHPDKRIDALEKRLATKDTELKKVYAQLAELSRRLAQMNSTIQSHANLLNRRS